MTNRFIRDYELRIDDIIVRPPLQIIFTCNKSVSGSLNDLDIEVYNLEESKRNALVKEAEQNSPSDYKQVELKLGYKGNIDTVFKGNLQTGIHQRRDVDYVNKLHCLDGGFDYINSFTSKVVKGKDLAVQALISDMPNTQMGEITTQPLITRPRVLFGVTSRLLEEHIAEDEEFFIDNEQIYIIKKDKTKGGSFVPLVSSQTGLLDTPQRKASKVTFTTVINPAIKIGQKAELFSRTAAYLNGTYKVTDINYSGAYEGDSYVQKVSGFLA